MSVLVDRIAEVLDEHRPWTSWGLTDDGIYCGGCGRRYVSFTQHVAERIAAEPQYVWVVHYDNYGDRWLHGIYDSEDKVEEFRPKDPEQPWKSDYEIGMVKVK